MSHLFCFGYGYTAQHFAERRLEKGWRVTGTTRSSEKAQALAAGRLNMMEWQGAPVPKDALSGVSAIMMSAPPGQAGCPTLNAARDAITANKSSLEWIGYLSTNGVYGDHQGAWVTEDSPLLATQDRSVRRIKAEQDWRAFANAQSLPLKIFRLPGIYGPGRSAIDAVRNGKARRILKEGQVFSRMHVDDITAALEASLNTNTPEAVFNLADDEPAPPQDVIEFACTLLGATPPPLIRLEDADLSEMAKSFYTDNKRVSNERIKKILGVALKFPTYREGLKAINQKT